MSNKPEKIWNYHPTLPLQDSSVFSHLNRPRLVLRWFVSNWLTLSEFVLLAILATTLWLLAYPSIENTANFEFEWILQVLMVNFVLVAVAAGGLHWFFYIKRIQAKKLKFDHRDQARKNRNFLFADQVKDNMFWSLSSGVLQLTFFQCVGMWLMANDYVSVISLSSSPIWFALSFVLIPIWTAFHFYWVHRFLHIPFVYKRVHYLHHKNINVGPWSGIAMHPIEHFLYFSALCIHWIVANHPVHLIFHVVWLGPGAAMSHTGYENMIIKDKRRLALGTFYHQLHHRYFECNYGNQEMPWDRWFGTFHDGSEASTLETRARKKQMHL